MGSGEPVFYGMIYSHESEGYRRIWNMMSESNRYNGAYYYSQEIVENIIPKIRTDRSWVTINHKGLCEDGSIVFIHNNVSPEYYRWLSDYEDLILICGVPSTCKKVEHLGRAIYLPLSVDVAYVESFKTEKTKDVAFVGRGSKACGLPRNIERISDMPRFELLKEMAKFRKVFAVGRVAIEAKILGCEVLAYDSRYPDPDFWKVLDNEEASRILQRKLDEIDGDEKTDIES